MTSVRLSGLHLSRLWVLPHWGGQPQLRFSVGWVDEYDLDRHRHIKTRFLSEPGLGLMMRVGFLPLFPLRWWVAPLTPPAGYQRRATK
jgi:hypothetical protein